MNDDLVTKVAHQIFSDRRKKYGEDAGAEPSSEDYDTARSLLGEDELSQHKWSSAEDDWVLNEEILQDIDSAEIQSIIDEGTRETL